MSYLELIRTNLDFVIFAVLGLMSVIMLWKTIERYWFLSRVNLDNYKDIHLLDNALEKGLSGDPSSSRRFIALQPETVAKAVRISPSELSVFSHHRLPLSSAGLTHLPWCLQAVPSALLRLAEELLLGRAVSLQRCPLAMSSRRPRSPAQLHSRGPARGVLMTPLVGLVPTP